MAYPPGLRGLSAGWEHLSDRLVTGPSRPLCPLHAAVLEAAKLFEREACEGVVPSIAAKSIREAVRRQWSREPWGKP